MSIVTLREETARAVQEKPPYDYCYICKVGWMDHEPKPALYNRLGLWLCKTCLDLMNSRARKA